MANARKAASFPPPRAPRSTLLRVTVLGWSALTIGALLICHSRGIPLGQGSFVYRFSELQAVRARHAWPVLPIAGLFLAGTWWLGHAERNAREPRRRARGAGLAALMISTMGLVAWVWGAPPRATSQHMFNLLSPSHEGAFLIELDDMERSGTTLDAYLRGFNRHIQASPKEMLGTRVISNPPGITVLFAAVTALFPPHVDPPGWVERALLEDFDAAPQDLARTVRTMQFALALLFMWALAAPVAYALGRLFLPPVGAAAFILIAWFNPSTVHFSPGKDPAQLLTIIGMLWLWFLAWKRNRPWLAAGAGAALVLGMSFGLIHLWVAAAAMVATAWQERAASASPWRWLLRLALPAAGGAAAVLLLVFLLAGWNMPATFIAVTRRFAQVQRGLALSQTIWLFIGIPIFLLFVSPGLAAFAALAARRIFARLRRVHRPAHNRWLNGRTSRAFGARLAISTALFMLLSYITGVTYELPRLWVAFLPPLTLGLVIASPLARARHGGKALNTLLFILAAQLLVTAAHWIQLDVRESEFRLTQGRFFTSLPTSSTNAPLAAAKSG